MEDITLINDDCLNAMQNIPDKSIDCIICDLPYGTTRNHWDSVINLDLLWVQYKRVIKDNRAIILFAQTPFDKILGASNISMLKYEWIWQKEQGTGFLNANYAPLKSHENILVFSTGSASHNGKSMVYNPQMRKGEPYICKQGGIGMNYDFEHSKKITTINNGERYPLSILKFVRDKSKFHPTQKPVALLEYLIKTYTNEGDLVLDNTMGSGSTGVACKNTHRRFIGIELDKTYFEIAKKRINGTQESLF